MATQLSQSFRSLSLGNHDVDLFLIGKTGNGKSATGNSILRKPGSFKAKPTTQSVTTKIHFDYSIFHGRTIKVVDGPGVGDTRMTNEEALKMVQERMTQAITANPDGYHAFLLVVRYGGRFTKEDVQTIECLKNMFGTDFVKRFCIVVVTYGDNFDTEDGAGITFDQWLQEQGGVFKQLAVECRNRVILFDNKARDETKKNDQVARLLNIVDSLGGQRYTDEHFEKARHLRDRQMIESKEPRVREETLRNTAVLIAKLKDVQRRDPGVQPETLKEMKIHANQLYQSVKEQDKGTGVLNYSLEAASSIVDQVNSQLEYCEKIITDRKKAEEERIRVHQEHLAKLKEEKEKHERQVAEEKRLQDERRAKEKKQMEMEWEEQREKEALLQQEKMEALKKEMENKMEKERLQRTSDLQEELRRQAAEGEKRRRKDQEEFQRKLQEQYEKNERKRKEQEEKFRKQQEEERKRREIEEQRREEKREKERQAERERHKREMELQMRKTEEAYGNAKEKEENSFWGFVKDVAPSVLGFVIKRFLKI